MSESSKDPLPQEAFRKAPKTDEDKFFAEQEARRLEELKRAKSAQPEVRRCVSAACEGEILEKVQLGDVEIDRCPKCGGVWLDPGELEQLTSEKKTSHNPVVRFFQNLAGQYD